MWNLDAIAPTRRRPSFDLIDGVTNAFNVRGLSVEIARVRTEVRMNGEK